ncbi:MAG: NAD(P)/FAD-dependent oxidoreductase [Deltaproteobacteria bacterium]|nr:NAD(P)/FAD-dependent oxidoreductase [Deltaproteobacteria bacterium]
MEQQYDVIVIGAGIGGATCAALLAKRGLKTLLVDKNSIPGGKAITMSKQGFRYEFWPICGGPSLNSQFAAVLQELGLAGEVELLMPQQAAMLMYRRAGSDRYEGRVGPAIPDPEGPLGMLELLALQAESLPEVARLLSDLVQLTSEEIARLEHVTFADFLARYQLPKPFVSYMGLWSNIVFVVPFDLLAASEAVRTFQDFAQGGAARYHSGGFGRVAEVCCQAVERFGGTVLLKTRVDGIRVVDGAVAGIVTDKGRFDAPIVVSNAGIQPTVLRLVGAEHFDRSYLSYVRGLVPSWGIMGIRYFLNKPFFDYPMYLAFSDDSYLDTARFLKMKAGAVPDELVVFNVVPAVYDPALAPPGKQCALVGTICSPDPNLSYQETMWAKLDAMVTRLWPGLQECVDLKEHYSTGQVSALTRDAVLPGQGGECIGLAQIVGQCGKQKPSAQPPLRGLFFVGCDAGGYGCGTHQAADSGVNVANLVQREHLIRATAY